jgi:hypothetical protein
MNNLRGNCLTELRLLQALDEELPLSEVWLVKLHLESCASCQERLEELQLVSSRVSELHQLVVPRDTAGPFAAQLAEEESREQPEPAWRRWLARPRLRWQQLAWYGAFALVALIALRMWTRHTGAAVPQIAFIRPSTLVASVPKAVVSRILAPPARQSRPRMRRSVPHQRIPPQAPAVVREVATPFFSLPFSDAALPLDQATVIRVELPRSALELAGLPVDEDRRNQRIRADLILGADGLARAIRFVE